jgi:protein-tyrosine phosphatase
VQETNVEKESEGGQQVLFVCMGNICRSPTAEGVVRKLLAERAPDLDVELDSAGTHSYHVGHPPDRRAQAAAQARGVDLSTLRARRVAEADFTRFDLILAMDQENLSELEAAQPAGSTARIALLLDYAADVEHEEVPDPYYGGPNGFEQVLDLVEKAAAGLLDALTDKTGTSGRR